MHLLRFIVVFPIVKSIFDSLVDNVFRDKVQPVRGAIIYCDLISGYLQHSGVYIGDNKIIHRNRTGLIEIVSPEQFIANTTAVSIYVSCKNKISVGNELTAIRAESQLNKYWKYSFYKYNCHQFCNYCLNGDFDEHNPLLSSLKLTCYKRHDTNSWRVWDI